MPGGLTAKGTEALDQALARHVGGKDGLPGLVARGGDVHVVALGHKAFGDPEPIGRDAIFRIASITKPIAGAAAMLLFEDGAMALDDPIKRWLAEFAEPKVLKSLESELDDTVPAERPITVEDVLSFRLGFGSIMAPGPFPVTEAEHKLGLKTLGPPWPPPELTPDQWIAGLASDNGETGTSGVPGGFGWEGGSDTTWRTDMDKGLTGILLTQRMATSPEPVPVVRDFWAAAYDAIDA